MQERTLLIVALVWSLIGLFILLVLASFAQPPQPTISQLGDNVGKVVVLNANVTSIDYKQDTVFFSLEDSTGNISAIFFGNPKYEIIVGDYVAVKGKVQLYKGDVEIVVQELSCLTCQ
ncbi:MAG: OB-fold nucleic acid binding domain-containing protein [DPANN group archaeon]|nr:OB-fold nucleic acid binding domain-containing protein [DPANN group archaeon]